MSAPVEVLQQRVAAVAALEDRIPGGLLGLTCAQNQDVVDLIPALQAVVTSAQGMLAAVGGEAARRSARGAEDNLAKRQGEASARTLLANRAGISFGDAARLVEVGEAIRPRTALSGEELPADRSETAAAVLAGVLPVHQAHLIDATLEKLDRVMTGDEAFEIERQLVQIAVSGVFSVRDFAAFCARLIDQYDPDGAKPRDEHLASKQSLISSMQSNGLLKVVALLAPESAAYFQAAMTARLNPNRKQQVTPDAATSDEAAEPDAASRAAGPDTTPQPDRERTRLEAFVAILRDAVRHDPGDQAGVHTTVLVRMTLDAFTTGKGSAVIDGIPTSVSAATGRRMACEAEIIPQVLGGNSQLLDQGEAKRTFTPAQRYALYARYDGCAFPKCDLATTMTQIHHIGGWKTRHEHGHGTDLANGIPLCGFHNRLMEDGWSITFDESGVPWFAPPPTLDPSRTPIRGSTLTRTLDIG